MRGAEAHPGLGHARPALRARGRERDAEIGHHRSAVVQQDVLGLDVAVDDAVAVGVVERVRDLAGDPNGLVHRELLLAREPSAKALALDVRHDIENEAVGLARVEQSEDVGVLQVGGGLDLGEEPLGAEDRGQLGAEHLERDLAVVAEVVGEVDGGHAALAQLALEAVAVGEGRREARCVGAHGGREISPASTATLALKTLRVPEHTRDVSPDPNRGGGHCGDRTSAGNVCEDRVDREASRFGRSGRLPNGGGSLDQTHEAAARRLTIRLGRRFNMRSRYASAELVQRLGAHGRYATPRSTPPFRRDDAPRRVVGAARHRLPRTHGLHRLRDLGGISGRPLHVWTLSLALLLAGAVR